MSTSSKMQGEIKTIEVTGRRNPPNWAVRQRHLIDLMNRAAVTFAARSTRPDGTLLWRTRWTSMDGTDNGSESFLSYPLFYLLGEGEHGTSQYRLPELRRRSDGAGRQGQQGVQQHLRRERPAPTDSYREFLG